METEAVDQLVQLGASKKTIPMGSGEPKAKRTCRPGVFVFN